MDSSSTNVIFHLNNLLEHKLLVLEKSDDARLPKNTISFDPLGATSTLSQLITNPLFASDYLLVYHQEYISVRHVVHPVYMKYTKCESIVLCHNHGIMEFIVICLKYCDI